MPRPGFVDSVGVVTSTSAGALVIVCPGFEVTKGGIEAHAVGFAHALERLGFNAELRNGLPPRTTTSVAQHAGLVIEGVHRLMLLKVALRRDILESKSLFLFTHGSFLEPPGFALIFERPELGRPGRRLLVKVFDRVLTPVILRRIETIAVLSPDEGQYLSERFGLASNQIFVSPICIWDKHEVSSPSSPERRLLEGPYVFAVGRIERRKNFPLVIPALQGTGIGFVLAGQDHGDLSRVRNAASAFPSVPFRYLGEITEQEKVSLIDGALAMVLPSSFEGTPTTVIEALSLGVPVITTRNSLLPEYDGLFHCEADPHSLREVILNVQTLVRAGRPHFRPLLPTPESVLHGFIARLQCLANHKPASLLRPHSP